MITIDYVENLDEEYYKIINREFDKYAFKNGITCEYKPFAFIAKC